MIPSRTWIPLVLVALVALLLAAGLRGNPRVLPSALIGKVAPTFELPSLQEDDRALRDQDLRGQVTLLNVWASWCMACRKEHDLLTRLAGDRELRIVGLNYKDRRDDARRWLKYYGDPYNAVAFDHDGRTGMDYGVYGVPETFLIDATGVIRFKHVGPLDDRVLRTEILPMARSLRKESG